MERVQFELGSNTTDKFNISDLSVPTTHPPKIERTVQKWWDPKSNQKLPKLSNVLQFICLLETGGTWEGGWIITFHLGVAKYMFTHLHIRFYPLTH